jgi:hypothetical protein
VEYLVSGKLLLVFASTVILFSGSRGTHDNISHDLQWVWSKFYEFLICVVHVMKKLKIVRFEVSTAVTMMIIIKLKILDVTPLILWPAKYYFGSNNKLFSAQLNMELCF